MQLRLAVEMHHHFASRYLIDILNEQWARVCSSYHEVQRFERNAALTSGIDVPNFTDLDHIQYIADNVDHNVCTLDGLNTFHGMEMLGTITPAKQCSRKIPRTTVANGDILAVGRVNINHMPEPFTGLAKLKYHELIIEQYHDKDSDALDTLWNYGRRAYIVFDGYNSGPATKDATHTIRINVRIAPIVQFTSDMVWHGPICWVFFKSEARSGSRKPTRCWDIVQTQQHLGNNVIEQLLFAYALSGCDTTSRLHGIGKPKVLKNAANNQYFRQQAAVLKLASSQQNEIIDAGENALVFLYQVICWICFVFNFSTKKYQATGYLSNHAHNHQLLLLHGITVSEFSTGCSSGKEWTEDWGWTVKENKLCALQPTYQQLLFIPWKPYIVDLRVAAHPDAVVAGILVENVPLACTERILQ